MNNPEVDRAIALWWTMQTELFRNKLVGHIQGTKNYGCVLSYQRLPAEARAIVVQSYIANRLP